MGNGETWKSVGKALVVKRPDVSSIRICKCYDGVVFPEDYIQDKSEKVEAIFADMTALPQKYAWAQKQKDMLFRMPGIEVIPLKNETFNDIPVIGQVSFTYRAQPPPQRMSIVSKIFLFLLLWSLLGALITVPILCSVVKQSELDRACYYYTKNGKPDVIEIDGMEYHLDENGLIDQVDRTFINAYHYEILSNVSRNCTHINVP